MRSGHGHRRLALLLAPLVLTACGGGGSAGGASRSGARSDVVRSDVPGSLTARDATGRLVRLAAPPRRIISLIPAATEMLLALGAGDRLVARTDYDHEAQLDTLPSVGGGLTPSLEWLVARRPDLVVAWPDRGARDVVARIAAAGIPVYAARMERLAQIRKTARDLGRLLGRAQRADSLVAALDRRLDAVRRAVAGLPRPRVLYLESRDPPLVVGSGTYIAELLRLAGGDNVFSDARTPWPQVSLEAIVERRPAVILVPLADTATAAPLAQLRGAAGWKELPAVRDGHVYAVPDDLFSRPGLHVDSIARRMAALLHPGAHIPSAHVPAAHPGPRP